MIERTKRILLFIFCSIIGGLSSFWIFFGFFNNKLIISREPIFQILSILSFFGIVISFISIYDLYTNPERKLSYKQKIEKNINEIHRYKQLFDPPDTEMYN